MATSVVKPDDQTNAYLAQVAADEKAQQDQQQSAIDQLDKQIADRTAALQASGDKFAALVDPQLQSLQKQRDTMFTKLLDWKSQSAARTAKSAQDYRDIMMKNSDNSLANQAALAKVGIEQGTLDLSKEQAKYKKAYDEKQLMLAAARMAAPQGRDTFIGFGPGELSSYWSKLTGAPDVPFKFTRMSFDPSLGSADGIDNIGRPSAAQTVQKAGEGLGGGLLTPASQSGSGPGGIPGLGGTPGIYNSSGMESMPSGNELRDYGILQNAANAESTATGYVPRGGSGYGGNDPSLRPTTLGAALDLQGNRINNFFSPPSFASQPNTSGFQGYGGGRENASLTPEQIDASRPSATQELRNLWNRIFGGG